MKWSSISVSIDLGRQTSGRETLPSVYFRSIKSLSRWKVIHFISIWSIWYFWSWRLTDFCRFELWWRCQTPSLMYNVFLKLWLEMQAVRSSKRNYYKENITITMNRDRDSVSTKLFLAICLGGNLLWNLILDLSGITVIFRHPTIRKTVSSLEAILETRNENIFVFIWIYWAKYNSHCEMEHFFNISPVLSFGIKILALSLHYLEVKL